MSEENAYGRTGGRYANFARQQNARYWNRYNDEQRRDRDRRESEAGHPVRCDAEAYEEFVDTVFSEEQLIRAITANRREKGLSPGRSGISFDDLDRSTLWELIRSIRRALQSGLYRPQPERSVSLPRRGKAPRQLRLLEIGDRAVATLLNHQLQLRDSKLFIDSQTVHSLAYRPRRCVEDTVLLIEAAVAAGRTEFLSADLKDAFEHVRIESVLDRLRCAEVNPHLKRLVEVVLKGAEEKTIGISQGTTIGPTCFNAALDQLHDRPFAEWCDWHYSAAFPSQPICIRYADDLLYLAPPGSLQEAVQEALSFLNDAELYTGQQANRPEHSPVLQNLEEPGVSLTMVGLTHRLVDGELHTAPSSKSWERILDVIQRAHEGPTPHTHAEEGVKGWIVQHGPGFRQTSDRAEYATRLCNHLDEADFGELLQESELVSLMESSHTRWNTYREQHRSLPS